MKNPLNGLWIIISLFAVLAAGCASLRKTPHLSSNLPFGIVSLVSNRDIYWYGESPQNSRISPNPEKAKYSKADQLINDADEILWALFLKTFITAYDGKNLLVGSEAYANGEIDRRLNNENHIIASGYRYINYRDKEFAANLARERGVKGGVYITFNFSKKMASGIGKYGSFRAMVEMQMLIVNEEGNVIYRKTRSKESDEKISVSFGFYNNEELMELFRITIEDLYLEYLAELDPNNPFFGPPEEGIIPVVPTGSPF
jgi:hypothetical protein